MSPLPTRLTLFAIIDGVERDQRDLVASYLDPDSPASAFLPDDLLKQVKGRMTRDGTTVVDISLADAVNWLDLVDPVEILNAHRDDLPSPLKKHLKEVAPELEKLAQIRKRVMHRRPLAPGDLVAGLAVAEKLRQGGPRYWPTVAYNMGRLNDPEFIMSLPAPDAVEDTGNLPLPDYDETGFIGRRREVRDIIKLLKQPARWFEADAHV